ncbi:tRNA(Ser) Um(44) 2'-O-methyltransferase [Schaereria dolodes]|nr:tRNA(Ser) Um(44) 2'-O-methyltransferase [Schaereria dolodes]
MLFEPEDLTSTPSTGAGAAYRLPDHTWIPILQHGCDFGSKVFRDVSLNLIKNPNINSTHLFRADILYDSQNGESAAKEHFFEDAGRLMQKYAIDVKDFPGFELKRTLVRMLVPRNPQLDKPIAQTCYVLSRLENADLQQSLIIYVPHASHVDGLPWYHPAIQSIAYLHTWRILSNPSSDELSNSRVVTGTKVFQGRVSIHYRLFPSQTLPLSPRLLRTACHLLSTLYKHGQGSLAGYQKRVHHDQLISQQRVQDRYVELKQEHAKRLCDKWVEQTEPTKHVFEDLGIAAFLIELWRDMYQLPDSSAASNPLSEGRSLPPFPGFVDIGCGNGVLTEVLLLSGYRGQGFDARHRKTWSILSPTTQNSLHELIFIPQPLFEMDSLPRHANGGLLSHRTYTAFGSDKVRCDGSDNTPQWHNGIFATGTFIISNHADELTPWTPLLALLSDSPFLAIPCCSHNLSGLRFRAPSSFNSLSADMHAPTFFAKNVKKSRSIAISVVTDLDDDSEELDDHKDPQGTGSLFKALETGDLKRLSISARAKQPSAYSSLCDWVAHLASEVGYEVEREMLRIPSTRNVGIVGRTSMPEGQDYEARRKRVAEIVRKEGADGMAWIQRCEGLKGKVVRH